MKVILLQFCTQTSLIPRLCDRVRPGNEAITAYCQYVSGYCQYMSQDIVSMSQDIVSTSQDTVSTSQSILPQTGNKFRCFEVKIQESEKSRQSPGIEPRTPLT